MPALWCSALRRRSAASRPRGTVTHLADLLGDPDGSVRAEAAAALGAIGSTPDDGDVLERLEKAQHDPKERVRHLAAEATRTIREDASP